jgi:hypothetical protein
MLALMGFVDGDIKAGKSTWTTCDDVIADLRESLQVERVSNAVIREALEEAHADVAHLEEACAEFRRIDENAS